MSSMGDRMPEVSMEEGDVGDVSRLFVLDLPLLPDFTDAISDFSSPLEINCEFRGLSVFPPPGILDRRDLKDRLESLVSDLLKDGYDWRPSDPRSETPEPPDLVGFRPPSVEFWLPMVQRRGRLEEGDGVGRRAA